MGSNQFNNSSYQEGDMFNMDRSSQQFADADLARELSDLTRAANRANTSFYTIDPRGLVGGPDLDEKVDPVEWGNYVRKSQDSLRVIAEETGGYAVVNQNDFDKALKRIDAETSDYYVIGYYSINPDPTKKNRQVEVKSKRSNVSVWARNSYSLKPPPRREEQEVGRCSSGRALTQRPAGRLSQARMSAASGFGRRLLGRRLRRRPAARRRPRRSPTSPPARRTRRGPPARRRRAPSRR